MGWSRCGSASCYRRCRHRGRDAVRGLCWCAARAHAGRRGPTTPPSSPNWCGRPVTSAARPARQVQKALAELSASLSTRSLRPPLLSTRLTRSLAHREQLHWQPVVDRRGRGLTSRVCMPGRSLVCQLNDSARSGARQSHQPEPLSETVDAKGTAPMPTSEQATPATEQARPLTSPGPQVPAPSMAATCCWSARGLALAWPWHAASPWAATG